MKQVLHFNVQPSWKVLIADLGVNPALVLRFAQLPGDLFARKDARMTAMEYFRLWRGLEQAAEIETLPLKIGQHISVEVFDPTIFASMCSANLNKALVRLAKFKQLIGPLTLLVESTADETRVTLDCFGSDEPMPRSLGAAELVFMTQLARLGTRTRVVPLCVEMVDLPDDRGTYQDFFGVSLARGAAFRLVFSATDAQRPFLTYNDAMWDFFEAGLSKQLSDLTTNASTQDRVRSVLQEMLPAGLSSIEETANRLMMSKRSLQRKLAEEASSYQEVLNTTRRELADTYLARSSTSLGEIAYLLGFQDDNSFIRAFRGWTGQTPGEYRMDTIKDTYPVQQRALTSDTLIV